MRNDTVILRGKKTIDGIWAKVRENRAWDQDRERKVIFTWDIAQEERQQGLDFVDNVFCKAHKWRRIYEAFFFFFLMLQSHTEERY